MVGLFEKYMPLKKHQHPKKSWNKYDENMGKEISPLAFLST